MRQPCSRFSLAALLSVCSVLNSIIVRLLLGLVGKASGDRVVPACVVLKAAGQLLALLKIVYNEQSVRVCRRVKFCCCGWLRLSSVS